MPTRPARSERGMSLLAVMAVMTLFAIGLLAVAPSVQQEIQREKEVEAVRRGEEVAEAIRQYVNYYRGTRLPNSIDDLLDGLPQGTTKRQILRASAAIDPLSADGKWRLIKPDPKDLGPFAKRVMEYNGGTLPSNPGPVFDRYSVIVMTAVFDPNAEPISDDDDFEVVTDNTPFIGVASQSRADSVIAYYGIENEAKWIFTPLWRGGGRQNSPQVQTPQSRPATPSDKIIIQ